MALKKQTMADYIREQMPLIPMDRICRNLGIPGISDGHLIDTTTIVEVNEKGKVMLINGTKPKEVPLHRMNDDIEVVPEEVGEEA